MGSLHPLKRMSFLASAIMLLALVSLPVQPALAQTAIPFDSARAFDSMRRSETVVPDQSLGEMSRVDHYLGDKLFRRVVRYQDGRLSTTEFLPTGQKKGEMIRSGDGTVTVKLFTSDGDGLYKVSIISPDQKVEQIEYRPDGETIWARRLISDGEQSGEYFDDAGRLKLRREFEKTGYMKVTVFSASGDVSYIQFWRPSSVSDRNESGYILDHLVEPQKDGQSRKVVLDRRDVQRCDYLDKAGSLIRSESLGNLSEPVDRSRLREFAPLDDPTIPRPHSQLPSNSMKQ